MIIIILYDVRESNLSRKRTPGWTTCTPLEDSASQGIGEAKISLFDTDFFIRGDLMLMQGCCSPETQPS